MCQTCCLRYLSRQCLEFHWIEWRLRNRPAKDAIAQARTAENRTANGVPDSSAFEQHRPRTASRKAFARCVFSVRKACYARGTRKCSMTARSGAPMFDSSIRPCTSDFTQEIGQRRRSLPVEFLFVDIACDQPFFVTAWIAETVFQVFLGVFPLTVRQHQAYDAFAALCRLALAVRRRVPLSTSPAIAPASCRVCRPVLSRMAALPANSGSGQNRDLLANERASGRRCLFAGRPVFWRSSSARGPRPDRRTAAHNCH